MHFLRVDYEALSRVLVCIVFDRGHNVWNAIAGPLEKLVSKHNRIFWKEWIMTLRVACLLLWFLKKQNVCKTIPGRL